MFGWVGAVECDEGTEVDAIDPSSGVVFAFEADVFFFVCGGDGGWFVEAEVWFPSPVRFADSFWRAVCEDEVAVDVLGGVCGCL